LTALRARVTASILALLACLSALMPMGGCCGFACEYLFDLGLGELDVVFGSRQIDQILDDPQTDPQLRDKLLWTTAARQFAEERIGLDGGDSYLSFFDTTDQPAAYNLSAARKDALVPRTWDFPFAGSIQFLPFFDLEQAEEYARRLGEQGYDTVIYGAIAYSTGGWFPDPVYSSMLELDKVRLAQTVIHEMTHNTIYKTGDTEFNESVANFMGRYGAMQFIAETLGEDSQTYLDAQAQLSDRRIVDQFFSDLIEQLDAFYDRDDLDSRQKIQQRQDIFDSARIRFQQEIEPRLHRPEDYSLIAELPVNNAWVLLHYRYNKGLDVFEQVYRTLGTLRDTVGVFRAAAEAEDSYQYLRDWLANR